MRSTNLLCDHLTIAEWIRLVLWVLWKDFTRGTVIAPFLFQAVVVVTEWRMREKMERGEGWLVRDGEGVCVGRSVGCV